MKQSLIGTLAKRSSGTLKHIQRKHRTDSMYQLRILVLFHDGHRIELYVQKLINRYQRATELHIVLKLDDELLPYKGFEKRVE